MRGYGGLFDIDGNLIDPNLHSNNLDYNNIPKILAKYDYAIMPYGKKVNVKSSNLDVANTMSPLKMFDYLASSQVILASDTNVYKHILINNYNSLLGDF